MSKKSKLSPRRMAERRLESLIDEYPNLRHCTEAEVVCVYTCLYAIPSDECEEHDIAIRETFKEIKAKDEEITTLCSYIIDWCETVRDSKCYDSWEDHLDMLRKFNDLIEEGCY